MAVKSSSAKASKSEAVKSDAAVSYDEFKEYEGKKYTGMKIGRSHKWYYDQGEWKEKKITPDLLKSRASSVSPWRQRRRQGEPEGESANIALRSSGR